MRHTRTGRDKASDHTLNDCWNEDSDAAVSEECVGTTRFQHMRTKLPEGYTWVNGRPTKVQHITRTDTIWPEEWTRQSQRPEKEELANWDDTKTRLQATSTKERLRRVLTRRSRLTQGDRRSSSKTFRTCVVPSMPCTPIEGFSVEPTALRIFCCSGKPETTLVSSHSSGQQGQSHQNPTGS